MKSWRTLLQPGDRVYLTDEAKQSILPLYNFNNYIFTIHSVKEYAIMVDTRLNMYNTNFGYMSKFNPICNDITLALYPGNEEVTEEMVLANRSYSKLIS